MSVTIYPNMFKFKDGSSYDSYPALRGETGAMGATGATGAQGPAGADGSDGADGVSPAVTITPVSGGHEVTITDAEHPAGQTFEVTDGTGVPNGGSRGQILAKASAVGYDTAWIDQIVQELYAGTISADTTNHDFTLPAGSLCILLTYEYNASTEAYRGHHAYLEYVPTESLYGTTAIQQANMAASSNAGVTVTRPTDSTLQLKCSAATYAFKYRILRVL